MISHSHNWTAEEETWREYLRLSVDEKKDKLFTIASDYFESSSEGSEQLLGPVLLLAHQLEQNDQEHQIIQDLLTRINNLNDPQCSTGQALDRSLKLMKLLQLVSKHFSKVKDELLAKHDYYTIQNYVSIPVYHNGTLGAIITLTINDSELCEFFIKDVIHYSLHGEPQLCETSISSLDSTGQQDLPPHLLIDELSHARTENKMNKSVDHLETNLADSVKEMEALQMDTINREQRPPNTQEQVLSACNHDEGVMKSSFNKLEEHKTSLLGLANDLIKIPVTIESNILSQSGQSKAPNLFMQLNTLSGSEFVIIDDTIYYISVTNELHFCNKYDSSKDTFISTNCIGSPVYNDRWVYYRTKSSELWRIEINQTLAERISENCDGEPAFYAAEKWAYFRQNNKLVCLNLQTGVYSDIHNNCGEMPPVVQENSLDSNDHCVWFQGGDACNELWWVRVKSPNNKKSYHGNCGNARPIVCKDCIYWLAGDTNRELWWINSYHNVKIGRSDLGPCGAPVLIGDYLYYRGGDGGLYKLKVFEKANSANRIVDSFIGNPVSGGDSFVYCIGNDNILRSLPVDTNLWLSNLNSKTCIFDINLPGSHDAVAYHKDIWMAPWRCQLMDIGSQLAIGIRVFDIRLQVQVSDLHKPTFAFFTCHGKVGLKMKINRFAPLREVMEEFTNFLKTYPKEFLVVSLKIDDWHKYQKIVEDHKDGITKKIECLNVLKNDFDHYFTYGKESQNGSHLLEDVRGKIFLINRLSADFTSWGLFINMGSGKNINEQIKTGIGYVWVQDTGVKEDNDQKLKRKEIKLAIKSTKPGQMSLNFTSWPMGFKKVGQGCESLWLLDYLSKKKNRPPKLGWILSNNSGDRSNSYPSLRRRSLTEIIIASNYEYADFQNHEEFPVRHHVSFNRMYSDMKIHLTNS